MLVGTIYHSACERSKGASRDVLAQREMEEERFPLV